MILSGLPGAGKTTIAQELARQTGAVHLRIDTIEDALRESVADLRDLGYRVAYALAEDNLRLGRTVVADSVNPIPLTRDAWVAVAERAGTGFLEIEVRCSDVEEHRRRVESRGTPTWAEVLGRDYPPWERERVVIDTAAGSVADWVREIRSAAPCQVGGQAG